MHRAPLIQLLKEYAQRYPNENETTDRYLDFVTSYPDCFERSQKAGHVTGSAWIVSSDGRETLLTHHKKLNRWLQPGGHADGQTDVASVAIREAMEESGLKHLQYQTSSIFDLDIHLIPARGDEPAHYHYDARFVLIASGSRDFILSEESHDLKWVPLESLEEFTTEESMLRMKRKWLARNP